jgi:signal transduction histidine kinase
MLLERQNQELRDLSDAERRQRELAESLAQATIAVNESLELDQVLCSILEQIRKSVPFQGADIILLEGGVFHVAGLLGFEDHPEGIPAMERSYLLEDFPLLQQVCRTLQPLNLYSVSEHPDWRVTVGMEWVRSHLTVPLLRGSDIIGVINLNSDRPRAYDEEMVELLMAFAAPAAVALHNAQMYKAELSARQGAEVLGAASHALTLSLDLDQRINILLEHICAIVPSDTAGVALLEDENHLGIRVMRGFEHWAEKDSSLHKRLEIEIFPDLHKVISTQSALLIPDSARYPEYEEISWLKDIHSWLIVPIVAGEKVIGVAGVGKMETSYFTQEHLQWAETLAGQAAVAIQNAWLFDQVRSSSERLQSLARKLVEIQENERSYIARELHDQAGQALSSLKLSLGRLERDPDCPQPMRQRLQDLKSTADGVLEELHLLALELRPIILDHLGLVAALEQYAKKMNSEQMVVRCKAIGFDGKRLPRDVETALYRIVQEALTNVVSHANASNVGILLNWQKDMVSLFIEDDGIGFSADLVENVDRLGLVGMRERAEMFGGTVNIESSPGLGTSIIVEVPDVNSYPDRR